MQLLWTHRKKMGMFYVLVGDVYAMNPLKAQISDGNLAAGAKSQKETTPL